MSKKMLGSAGVHGASASALGYQYQVNWALVELIRRGGEKPDQTLTLELHDDVSWDRGCRPIERIQVKHSTRRQYGLSDSDPDLWGTLGVWMDTSLPSSQDGALLVLVTTSLAKQGTATTYLKPDRGRDEAKAAALLESAAKTSTNKSTKGFRERYLELSPAERLSFVSRIHILDGQPNISHLEDELRGLLWVSLPAEPNDATYLDLVWQWWAKVALALLMNTRGPISASEVRQELNVIREMFSSDNLPTLVELENVDELEIDLHLERPFVHQLQWVKVRGNNLQSAIVDYHRAVTQTTDWIDRDLIGLSELTRFEANLIFEWETAFNDMLEDLPDDATDAEKQDLGKKLFRKVRDSTSVLVRERYRDSFYARGKRHELADRGRMGWHPEFEQKLEQLLLPGLASDSGGAA